MTNISGFTVLRNGVSLGYPFIESILSLLPLCDEFVVSEGYSDDDTYYWLERLKGRHPDKIRLFRDRWPDRNAAGGAIGEMQTRALRRCRGRWAYLLQADEIMPPENIAPLRDLCRPRTLLERAVGRRRFNSYRVDFLHVVDGFQRGDPAPDYRWAIRLVRTRPVTRRLIGSGDDGWQLHGPGCSLIGVAALPRPVFHVGYNFPVNVWRKYVSHAGLYPGVPLYEERARDGRERLAAHRAGAAPALPRGNPLGLPALVAPLIGEAEYRVRESLFGEGQ